MKPLNEKGKRKAEFGENEQDEAYQLSQTTSKTTSIKTNDSPDNDGKDDDESNKFPSGFLDYFKEALTTLRTTMAKPTTPSPLPSPISSPPPSPPLSPPRIHIPPEWLHRTTTLDRWSGYTPNIVPIVYTDGDSSNEVQPINGDIKADTAAITHMSPILKYHGQFRRLNWWKMAFSEHYGIPFGYAASRDGFEDVDVNSDRCGDSHGRCLVESFTEAFIRVLDVRASVVSADMRVWQEEGNEERRDAIVADADRCVWNLVTEELGEATGAGASGWKIYRRIERAWEEGLQIND